MDSLPAALLPLNAYRQFIVYVLVQDPSNNKKFTKIPIDHQKGYKINPIESDNWIDAVTAIESAKSFGQNYGVGFVLTKDDPFFLLDIDACFNDTTKKWSDLSSNLVNLFGGAAVEVSSSGRGLHVIGSTKKPVSHVCKNDKNNIELYTQKRFIALTGTHASGSVLQDCTSVLLKTVDDYFKTDIVKADKLSEWTTTGCQGWDGPHTDKALLDKALNCQSPQTIFGGKASFKDLWEGNINVLSKIFPSSRTDYNQSRADSALAWHLAFWTGKNCERILKLMWSSKLVRDKWDRADYLPTTISKACYRQNDFYTDNKPSPKAALSPVAMTNDIFLSVEQQIKYFEGCVYVQDAHAVFVPGGDLLKPDQFKVMYAGKNFVMDINNQRITRNAWEAFTESQGWRAPRVNSTCFRPASPPGIILNENDRTLVNTWWPLQVPRAIGDPTPFLNHLKKNITG